MRPNPIHPGTTIRLRDGRALGYAEFGDLDGRPLFYMHGFPASRLEARLIDGAARENAVRIIATDRPGYGLSDYQPERRMLDFPADIAELADRLGIQSFAILGVSGGGPYALACGAGLAERITALGVVCGLGPVYEPWALKDMTWPARLGFVLAQRSEFLLRLVYGGINAKIMHRWPQTIQALTAVSAPNVDKAFLHQAEVGSVLQSAFKEALSQGPDGALLDFSIYAHPWGFDLGEIHLPTRIWYGDADALVPYSHIRFQAQTLPDVVLTTMPGEGHFSLPFGHMDDILRGLFNR